MTIMSLENQAMQQQQMMGDNNYVDQRDMRGDQ
jgi:hypothetical protein